MHERNFEEFEPSPHVLHGAVMVQSTVDIGKFICFKVSGEDVEESVDEYSVELTTKKL